MMKKQLQTQVKRIDSMMELEKKLYNRLLNGIYGKIACKELEQHKRNRINALLESHYYEQILDECCEGDWGFNNNFRNNMTVGDCIEANNHAEMWRRVAEIC